MIKGKSPQQIRDLFNIVNDFSPEEEVSFMDGAPRSWLLTIPSLPLQVALRKENVS